VERKKNEGGRAGVEKHAECCKNTYTLQAVHSTLSYADEKFSGVKNGHLQ